MAVRLQKTPVWNWNKKQNKTKQNVIMSEKYLEEPEKKKLIVMK